MSITEDTLKQIEDRKSLFAFLHDTLRWPVDSEDTFTYEGPRLDDTLATRAEVSQIVPFTAGDPFTIFLVEFQTEFRRTDLREILRRIRAQIRTDAKYEGRSLDEIIFVCATEGYQGIRFAHFETRDKALPRLRVFGFDRDQGDGSRTLRDFNLLALTMPAANLLGEPDWTEGRKRWMTAWDVEQVTSAFFRRYKEVFNLAQAQIIGIDGDAKRLCAQRLFNRLLFIRFLEKKGWLVFRGRHDYLRALWDAYQANPEETNFYNSRLKPLFFAALNKPHLRDGHGKTWLETVIGNVPYLNGGLFDDAEDLKEAQAHPSLTINDAALAPVVTDFFYAYNFTVTESTPDDIEVAVDPEMLGKVFEELVTGRHETGSYYTPRPIVAFMCREALKGYLGGHAELVDERQVDSLTRKQASDLIARLKAVKIVDPAGGSGAYVLGMLHELFELLGLLEVRADPLSPRDKYRRKLEIIQNSLYAVDIDEFAVNIARLRLWLSLAVEFDGPDPQPLPNLDFKIEAGDSLTAPSPQADAAQVDTRANFLREMERKKRDFGNPYYDGPIAKPDLKKQIDALRTDIATWTHAGKAVSGFDWRVEFSEVFQREEPLTDIGGALNFGGTLSEAAEPGGFDIVLANPPYVRQELIKDQKPTLKTIYPEVYAGTADLYCYFYARAIQLLRPGGMLAFITPNKWFRAGYGANLRKHIADTCHVGSITDFGDLPVFQSATTYPMIFLAQKQPSAMTETCFTEVKTLNPPYPNVLALIQENGHMLRVDAMNGADWRLTGSVATERRRKMDNAGPSLAKLHLDLLNGVKTGYNRAFLMDDNARLKLIDESPEWEPYLYQYLMGDEIRKYKVQTPKRWVIYIRWSDELPPSHPVMRYLSDHRIGLMERDGVKDGGKCPWFALSRPRSESFPHYRKPKIVFPDIAKEPRFALDTSGAVVDATAFVIPTDDLYLLGVLNSKSVADYFIEIGASIRGGYLRFKRQYLETIPIPNASEADRATIAALVQKCLDAKSVGCEVWEQEINERVAALYGL